MTHSSEIRPYPVDNLRHRGHYVALLTGPDDKYVVAREFLSGRKRGRTFEYAPDDIGTTPAWIVRAGKGPKCGECGTAKPRVELIAAHPHGWQVVGMDFTSADLLKIWESGTPGADPETQITEALDDRVPVYAADKEIPF